MCPTVICGAVTISRAAAMRMMVISMRFEFLLHHQAAVSMSHDLSIRHGVALADRPL